MYEFAERMKDYSIKCFVQLRVSDVERNVLEALKDGGVYMIGYGIESMSNKILKSMKKNISTDQISRALKLTRETKLGIQANLIFGDPEETEETIKETLNWWRKHKEYAISLVMIVSVPNSPLYEYALGKGLIKDELQFLKDKFPIVNLTKINLHRFNQLRKKIQKYNNNPKYVLTGRVLSSKKINKKLFYEFYYTAVKCPECKKIITYKLVQDKRHPLARYGLYFFITCRDCKARFLISRINAFTESKIEAFREYYNYLLYCLYHFFARLILGNKLSKYIFYKTNKFFGLNLLVKKILKFTKKPLKGVHTAR